MDENADPNAQTPTTTQAPAAAAAAAAPTQAPVARTFTQLEVDRIVNERLARDRATRGGTDRPAAQPAPATTATQRTADPADALALIELRDAFDDAVGDLSLKAKQRALLRTSVMRDRPADVGAYVAKFVDDAGWSMSTTTPTQATSAPVAQAAAATAQPAHPVTDRSPPPPSYVVTESTPLLQMKPHDRDAALAKLVAQHGVDKGNAMYVERYMAELTRDRVRVATR